MSQHYSTEPPPTASATLETTVGPLHISLFAKQTPLACRNFLQHCLDGYYTNTVFHRVVPGFIIQGGDPTGTGSGGQSIYEDPEFEYDPDGRDPNERIVLRDELHSRLRFNRRGLVGLAKSEDGTYGSQFFITLANAERELNGQCTLFGRLEGDSIYNVIKIAEAELVEGTDRPVYPVKITACHVGELGPLEGKLKKRQRIAVPEDTGEKPAVQKKKKKGKVGKALLSFDADEGTEEVKPTKPKFNTKLISHAEDLDQKPKAADEKEKDEEPTRASKKRARSPSPRGREPEDGPRKTRPKTPDPYHQVPPKDPEVPEHIPPDEEEPTETTTSERTRQSALERTKAEIEALKASMRRNVGPTKQDDKEEKKSVLESMIPKSSMRGRKRPGLGANPVTNPAAADATDSEALRLFNDFKAKLESTTLKSSTTNSTNKKQENASQPRREQENKADEGEEEEEPQPCDLHFIVNCQSCRDTFTANADNADGEDDANDTSWMTHRLTFGKDTLGKDLNWKKTHHAEEELDNLMVIDPREKEKEIREAKRREKQQQHQQQRGSAKSERDRESELRKARRGEREWDR
ncbi:hypothetical protein VTN31DRAFT_6141 [Thermomyces dupontii]|uniref:uncharacterized protein n=1 Tax=Talaromyces thermophilus TaxID=28565 RepID=UPI003743C97A